MYRWNDLKSSSPVEYIKKVFPEKNIVGPYKHFHTIMNKKEIPAIEQTAPLENELNYFINSVKSNICYGSILFFEGLWLSIIQI